MKAKNNKISETPPDKDGILGDLNFTYKRRALKESPNYGITGLPQRSCGRCVRCRRGKEHQRHLQGRCAGGQHRASAR